MGGFRIWSGCWLGPRGAPASLDLVSTAKGQPDGGVPVLHRSGGRRKIVKTAP